ncbi:hypothetical protein ABPG75_009018 [Micractinium tetrahymenae]
MEGEREIPNPIEKAAASSSLPRQARARVGQTTDPVPEGKVVDAEPEHHFKVEPASHDVERSQPKAPSEMGLSERQAHMAELAKMQGGAEGTPLYRQDVQAGMDYQGASTAANKKMDSRHRRGMHQHCWLPAFQASGKAHSKHTDTVYHHKGKQ